MNFVSAVLSLSQKHERRAQILVAHSVQKGVCSRKERTGNTAYTTPGTRVREEAGADERSESATVGMEGREGKRWNRALEETKGVFSCRRRIQMERSGLFSSRSPANLPTYLYVRGLRGLMSPGMLPKIEWLTRANIFAAGPTLKRRSRENVQLASRACMRGP
jgi:hypothetical protein